MSTTALLPAQREESEPALFFLHIRKSAGSSVRFALMNHFDVPSILLDWHERRHRDKSPDAYRFVTGHCPYDAVQRFAARPHILVFLREPLERALSAFYFYRHATPAQIRDYHDTLDPPVAAERERVARRAAELGVSRFLREEEALARKWLSNVQTRVLAGATELDAVPSLPDHELLDIATQNLACCETVGLAERMDDSLRMLAARLRLPSPGPAPHVNRTSRRPPNAGVPPEALQILAEWNQLDHALYAHAVQRFDSEFDLASFSQDFNQKPHRPADGAHFTFDRRIPGSGWHPREFHNGRWICWTGPETRTSLYLNTSTSGPHRLDCRIEHVLADDVLNGLAIRANDIRLSWRKLMCDGQTWLTADVPARCIARGRPVCLHFETPRTLRPSELAPGCIDGRSLGVAFSCLRLWPHPVEAATSPPEIAAAG